LVVDEYFVLRRDKSAMNASGGFRVRIAQKVKFCIFKEELVLVWSKHSKIREKSLDNPRDKGKL